MAATVTQLNPNQTGDREPELTLLQRLNAVERDLPAIAKNGNNKDQNYKYIEAAAVVSTLRELFGQYGVFLKSELVKVDFSDFTSKSGARGERTVAWFKFTFCNCSDKEDSISFEPWPGVAMDYSDKALGKAMTAAQKTFLMKQFLVSDIDPDADSPVAAAAPRNQQPTSAPTRAAQPAQQGKAQPAISPNQQQTKPAESKTPRFPKLTGEEFKKILTELKVTQEQMAEAISGGKFKSLGDWKTDQLANVPAAAKVQDFSRYALHEFTVWLMKERPSAGWVWDEKEGLPRQLEDVPFEEQDQAGDGEIGEDEGFEG